MNCVPHIFKLENVLYSEKTFWLSTEPTSFLDNFKLGEKQFTEGAIEIDNMFVINTFHSCFAHAVMDSSFPYFWAIKDIRQYENNLSMEFQLFVRQKEVLLFSQQNLPLIDSDKKQYKNAWNTLVKTLSSKPILFEHLLNQEDVFFIKKCYVYSLHDNNQRSAWNCITNYPDVHVQPKDVLFSDEIIRSNLIDFTKYVKSCLLVDSSTTSLKSNIIIIDRKTSYRNINANVKSISEIIQRKCQTFLINKKYHFNGVIFLEDLTLSEQISIFQTNDIIISPHGANLIHSIWFPNKTIIEIFFEEEKNIMYKRICNLVGNEIIQIHHSNICSFLDQQF